MKIVLMSDSHGNSGSIKKVILENRDADYFYHLGDVCDNPEQFPNITFVKGNNDYWYDLPEYIIANIEGHRIYMTHSHKINGMNKKKEMAKIAKENNCDIFCYGHTHIYDNCMIDGILLLNPGSTWYNRDYSDPCYMVVEIMKNDIKICRKSL